jgi:branched-chain amino acid aminotransferase
MPALAIWKIIISENDIVRLENVSFKTHPASLNSASRSLPRGVYTTMRTYDGNKILPIIDHLKRLETSAMLLGHKISLCRDIFHKSLQIAIKDYLPGDTRIRFTVDLDEHPGDLFLSIEPLQSPSQRDYSEGVVTVTCPGQRENPESKQTSFIETAERIRHKMPIGVHECLLLDGQGYILEGLSSNFFYEKDGTIRTATKGILSGITRSMVIKAAAAADIPLLFEAAHVRDVPSLEEAFLTSSTRSVLPICQIDNIILGKPGLLTLKLQAAYWATIKDMLVDL